MTDSTQHTLDRIRSPRVHITYDVEIGNAIQLKELPYVIGILADISGMPVENLQKLKDRKFVETDRDNFCDIMKSINPRIAISVSNKLDQSNKDNQLGVELFFKSIDDFCPISIAQQVPQLKALYDSRILLHDLIAKLEGNDVLQHLLENIGQSTDLKDTVKKQIENKISGNQEQSSPDDVLEKILKDGRLARGTEAEERACHILTEYLKQLENQKDVKVVHVIAFVEKIIADIDSLLSDQINEILHHPSFQKLEGTWRGLHFLVMNSETGVGLKLRLLNVTKQELLDDVEKAIEFDQSVLFKKIYEEEYGTFGGNPYSCLVGGYEFTRHPQDIFLLEKISNIAAAAHAPFIAAAHPRLFDLDSFSSISLPRDLAKIFESTEMIKWRSFRDSEDSRYTVLTLPHVLMRLPYGPDTLPVEGMNFVEKLSGIDNSKFCWGNSAFALAQRITTAISKYNWPAAIRGVEGGGLVEGLPAYTFKTTDGDIILKCPTEVTITDRREKELGDLGFLALCHNKGTDCAAFFGGQTNQKPKIYNTDQANANAKLSTKLPYILAASRFAHYVKAIMRDKVGSFLSKNDVSVFLNNWIAGYVLLNDGASQDLKAKYPLREARIDVFDVPGKPGCYRATIFLRPHFQLDELTASIRLVATLPPPAQ